MTEETSSEDSQEVEPNTAPDGVDAAETEPKGRSFSEDEVEAIVKKRLARDRRKRAKEQHQEQEPKRERKESRDSGADAVMAELRQLRAETELAEAMEDAGLSLNKKMRARIKRMFRADSPEDAAEWLEEIAEDLGITQSSSNSSNEGDDATSVESDEPSRKAVQDFGPARRAPQDFDAISNPNELTRADIEHMQRKYGKEAANRKIRIMAEEYYKGKMLPLGG